MLETIGDLAGRIEANVDLGNLLVGLATLMLAASTIFLAIRTSRHEARYRIASFRQQWIDGLREKFITYGRQVFSLTGSQFKLKADPDQRQISTEIVGAMAETQVSILLMLNPKEDTHRALYRKMDEVHMKILEIGACSKDDDAGRRAKFIESRDLRREMVNLQKKILKVEWDRVRAEVHGHSRLRRWLKSKLSSKDAGLHDEWWSEDIKIIGKEV